MESFKVLNGAPSYTYMLSSTDKNTLWNLVSDAMTNKYLVGIDTGVSSAFSLPTYHAYTILSNHQLKDT